MNNMTLRQIQSLLQPINTHLMMIRVCDGLSVVFSSDELKAMTPALGAKESPFPFICKEDRPMLERHIRQAHLQSSPKQILLNVMQADGIDHLWQAYAVQLTPDGTDEALVMVMMTDTITSAESADAFAAIMEHCPIGIGVFCGDSIIHPIYANSMLLNMIGSTKQEFSAKRGHDMIDFIDKRDTEKFHEALRQVQEQDLPQDLSVRIARKDCAIQTRLIKLPKHAGPQTYVTMCTDVTSEKRSMQRLDEDYQNIATEMEVQRLRFVLEHSNIETFEVDIAEKTMTCSATTQRRFGFPTSMFANMPEGVISEGTIHPDSHETYRSFYSRIFSGQPETSCIVRARRADGSYGLLRLVCKTFFNKDGRPIRSFGVSQDMDDSEQTKLAFDQEEQLGALMGDQFFCVAKVNISRNTIERLQDTTHRQPILTDIPYEQYLMENFISKCVAESRDSLFESLSRNAVMKLYQSGSVWQADSFKVLLNDGKIYWLLHHAHLCLSPYNGDLYMFSYLRNHERIKKAELMLDQHPTSFPRSPYYDDHTFRSMVQIASNSAVPTTGFYGMAVFRLINWDSLATRIPADALRKVRVAIYRKMGMFIGDNAVIGQLSDTEILIFRNDIKSYEQFVQYMQELSSIMSSPNYYTVPWEHLAEFTVGISCIARAEASYDTLLFNTMQTHEQANRHLHMHFNRINDCIEERNKTRFLPIRSTELNRQRPNDSAVPSLVQDCSHVLADSKVPCSKMHTVLQLLGTYFKADRAYILELEETDKLFNTYEWCGPYVASEIENLQDIPFSQLPTFLHAQQTKQMFIMYDTASASIGDYERNILVQQDIQSMIIFPLIYEGAVFGFIGIDNPQVFDEASFAMHAVAPLITTEILKANFLKKEKEIREIDGVSGAKGRNALNDFLKNSFPESLSSAGAYMVKIQSLDELNEKQGMEFVDKMLRTITILLQEAFGTQCVYRYGDSTLLALPQDMGYEKFQETCLQTTNQLQELLLSTIMVGFSWDDKLMNFNTLIANATILMFADKREKERTGDMLVSRDKKQLESRLTRAIYNGQASIFLQPKVSLKDGSICGAEALIRIRNEEGKIEPPFRFIPLLERHGLIGHVDRFVLRQTVSLLAQWIQAGKKAIPISLNFSRNTFIEPQMMQYVCDVCEEFGVDQSLVQIEITETIGDLERESIASVANKFSEKGINLALDDFGAKYSNLSILSVVPFNCLKLDKAMIDLLVPNDKMRTICRSVIKLCHEAGIETVAEGVEQKEQYDLLKNLNCDKIQGYYINKPLPVADFEALYMTSEIA